MQFRSFSEREGKRGFLEASWNGLRASASHLGASCGGSGISWTGLGASWVGLGASWIGPEVPWTDLGASWGGLGASWVDLGTIFRPLAVVLGLLEAVLGPLGAVFGPSCGLWDDPGCPGGAGYGPGGSEAAKTLYFQGSGDTRAGKIRPPEVLTHWFWAVGETLRKGETVPRTEN